jgi:hypothetical protein
MRASALRLAKRDCPRERPAGTSHPAAQLATGFAGHAQGRESCDCEIGSKTGRNIRVIQLGGRVADHTRDWRVLEANKQSPSSVCPQALALFRMQ